MMMVMMMRMTRIMMIMRIIWRMMMMINQLCLQVKNVFGEDADEYCVKASTSAGSRSSRAELVIKSLLIYIYLRQYILQVLN